MYQCKDCNKFFKLEWHYNRHINDKHKCLMCDNMICSHPGKKFCSHKCSIHYRNKNIKKSKLQIKHICLFCGQKFYYTYAYKRHLKNRKICEFCNKKFCISKPSSQKKSCSIDCHNKFMGVSESINKKRSMTLKLFLKIPEENIKLCIRNKIVRNRKEVKEKERKTNEKNRHWIPLSCKTDYEIYTRFVGYFTFQNNLNKLENYDKRDNHAFNKDAYHLDHRFSISEGFRSNIPPYIIGNINNLEMIQWRENVSKSGRCSIVKEELFKLIFGEILC